MTSKISHLGTFKGKKEISVSKFAFKWHGRKNFRSRAIVILKSFFIQIIVFVHGVAKLENSISYYYNMFWVC
jgi:hypothetical protein